MRHVRPALFIGGDFEESQFLYLIPFIHGYLKEQNPCSIIIFEHQLSQRLLDTEEIADILSHYEVRYLIPLRNKRLKTLYRFFIYGLGLESIWLAAKTYGRNIKNLNWHSYQMIHSVLDQSRIISKDGKVKPSFVSRYKSALIAVASMRTARNLVDYRQVHTVVLGHTVYRSRAMLAEFRKYKHVKVIAQASNVLYTLGAQSDRSWSIITPKEVLALTTQLDSDVVQRYWSFRREGQSAYFDAKNAYNGAKVAPGSLPKNLIFLHVFRDSAFNYLDRSRLFFDYVDWILHTLDILESSRETWLIRLHPSANRWGEDQEKWLVAISRQLSAGKLPSNVFLDKGGYSNLSLIESSSRVVTYHGSVHLEAGSLGIKPITISETTMGGVSPESVHKPKSLEEYKNLLLMDSQSSDFRLDNQQKSKYQALLYIRENMLGFREHLGSMPLYRGDSKDVFDKNFKSVLSRMPSLKSKFEKLGYEFSKGLDRSVHFDFQSKFTAFMRNYKEK